MNGLIVGQVLWLYLRPSKNEPYMTIKHPYLIIEIKDYVVNVLQLDTYDRNRLYRATKKSSVIIPLEDPREIVIAKDSYAHLEKLIVIEKFDELASYRKCEEVLSPEKLSKVKYKYDRYKLNFPIPADNFSMNYTKNDIVQHNPIEQ